MTKEKLLEMFPDYKPTVYKAGAEDDFIEPIFTYWDRVELEEMALEEYNKKNQQGVLFL